MPSRSVLASFQRDWQSLTSQQQRQFLATLKQFRRRPKEVRVVLPSTPQGQADAGAPRHLGDELAPDGRATFEYGDEAHPGQAHIIWRRVGIHLIFRRP
jgi:hypothetical protein